MQGDDMHTLSDLMLMGKTGRFVSYVVLVLIISTCLSFGCERVFFYFTLGG
jgi:hypothetical protein